MNSGPSIPSASQTASSPSAPSILVPSIHRPLGLCCLFTVSVLSPTCHVCFTTAVFLPQETTLLARRPRVVDPNNPHTIASRIVLLPTSLACRFTSTKFSPRIKYSPGLSGIVITCRCLNVRNPSIEIFFRIIEQPCGLYPQT